MLFASICGCATPIALRKHTISQSDTVADIHQQQVLDNLARFVSDPYAVPSFALTNAGTTEVIDRHAGGVMLDFIRSGFNFARFSADGSRQNRGTWTTVPITDPRKLELMRCAYQRTLDSCGVCSFESACCPDCRKRFNQFYTGRAVISQSIIAEMPAPDGSNKKIYEPGKCYQCDGEGQLANLVPSPCEDPAVCERCACNAKCHKECGEEQGVEAEITHGPNLGDSDIGTDETLPPPKRPDVETYPREACSNCYCSNQASAGSAAVTSECLYSDRCWFCWSRDKSKVPKCCTHVGHYCGIYVWVPNGPGRDALAKLTLAMLDYAQNTGASVPRKTVYAFLDDNNKLTTPGKASFLVSSEVSTDDLSRSIVKADLDKANQNANIKLLEAWEPSRQELAAARKNLDQVLTKTGISRKVYESTKKTLRVDGKRDWTSALEFGPTTPEKVQNTVRNMLQAADQRLESAETEFDKLRSDLRSLERESDTPLPSPVPSSPTPTPFDDLLFQQQLLDTVR